MGFIHYTHIISIEVLKIPSMRAGSIETYYYYYLGPEMETEIKADM